MIPCPEIHKCTCPHPEPSRDVEELAKKLHEWYLEACQRPESNMDFNPKAQEPYEALPNGSKFLDRYIAEKVIFLLLSERTALVEECVREIKKWQKNLLSQFAYQGADIPKTLIRDLKNQSAGYKECRDDVVNYLLTKKK